MKTDDGITNIGDGLRPKDDEVVFDEQGDTPESPSGKGKAIEEDMAIPESRPSRRRKKKLRALGDRGLVSQGDATELH